MNKTEKVVLNELERVVSSILKDYKNRTNVNDDQLLLCTRDIIDLVKIKLKMDVLRIIKNIPNDNINFMDKCSEIVKNFVDLCEQIVKHNDNTLETFKSLAEIFGNDEIIKDIKTYKKRLEDELID